MMVHRETLMSPLFVIGSPRSGTSLLRLILTTHSRILIPPECGFVIWLRQKYGDWQVTDNNKTTRCSRFLDDLFACKKFDTWFQERSAVARMIIDHQPSNYAELCGVVYASFGNSTGKRFSLWGDKNNFHTDHLGELRELYRAARFLHIVRDGRDVACSYREVMAAKSGSPYAPVLETGIGTIAVEWSGNVMKVDNFTSSLPPAQAMTVRYEDLVSSPASTIKGLCGWLGLEFEAGMQDFHEANRQKKLEPALTLDWKIRTLQPISDLTVGRYCKFLSAAECDEFVKVGENALRRFAYV